MDLPKKQGNRREIGGFFEIHLIRKKTPKFGGVKNPELKEAPKCMGLFLFVQSRALDLLDSIR